MLYGTVYMKQFNTRISEDCLWLGAQSPPKSLIWTQKKAVMQGQILFTTVNFWFLATKYGIWHIILFQIFPSKWISAEKGN